MTESKLTKFSALFLALLTLLGTVFSVPVTAATGDKAVITFTYCYDSNGNTIKFHQTAVHDGYTVGYDGMCNFSSKSKKTP